MSNCYHCLSPITDNAIVYGKIKGRSEKFCCSGCLQVACWINESGLDQYYSVRDSAPKAENINLSQYQAFDITDIYQKYTCEINTGIKSIDLVVEGIHCAACVWLIEKSLLKLPGVIKAEGNATTFMIYIEWDDNKSKISDLLIAIAKLGYQPFLNRNRGQQERYGENRRIALKRLALAGLGMMQVMMYSVALYTGAWYGISPAMEAFLQWVSFFLSTPIFFYSGFPFIKSAWQAIKVRHLNMDVPVSLAITLAYIFSIKNLLLDSGEIYFDSVVMFIFFLSVSRYLEMMGRYNALLRIAKNTAILPDVVGKVDQERLSADINYVPIDALKKEDLFIVQAGEIIAADGVVLLGKSTVDESLLTGESHPIAKAPQARVLAGSVNQEQKLLIRVRALEQQTLLAKTKRLLISAQTQKPQVQRVTDQIAAYIIIFILLSTAISFISWQWIFHVDNAFAIALSVLVATCPCALSLAVPTAYSVAVNMLANQRLFIKNNKVIDIIPKLSYLLFDKTGTLTTNKMQVIKTDVFADTKKQDALAIAAALEEHIYHPIAKAFTSFKRDDLSVMQQKIISGMGVKGMIDGVCYTLGNRDFVAKLTEKTLTKDGVYLCREKTPIAHFLLSDEINPYAKSTMSYIVENNLQVAIVSGDNEQRVTTVAKKLGIKKYKYKQLANDKLQWLQSLQQKGERVMMIGDGINDAPVLASADVSMALDGASALSQLQSDIILLNNDLRKIFKLFKIANKTHKIIRQNIIWAISYNLIAVPFAILGYLPPWLAALGMSVSSIFVLGNTLRIYWIK